jgi:hypothetical protein
MYQYRVWVNIGNQQTANAVVWADNDFQAKMLAESMYGQGNVLNYTRV